MSKTKGNVIDPIEIVKQYGTDAVRFTLASMASPGTDIAFNVARTEGYRAFANKIWNAARFIFMNVDKAAEAGYPITSMWEAQRKLHTAESLEHLEKLSKELPEEKAIAFRNLREGLGRAKGLMNVPTILQPGTPIEARWIVAELHATAAKVNESLENYRFDEAASIVYQFFWGSFCDWYLEIVKLRLDFTPLPLSQDQGEPKELTDEDERIAARFAQTFLSLGNLLLVFETSLRMLSPFMPFITEEIWHAVYDGTPPRKSIALAFFPNPGKLADEPDPVIEEMAFLQNLITEIRALRKEIGVEEKSSIPIEVRTDAASRKIAEANRDIIERLARVSEVRFVDQIATGLSKHSIPAFDVAVIYERTIDVPAERDRLTKDIAKYEKGLAAAERQLGNEGFLAKAPPHVVEGLKKQEAETRFLLEKAQAALNALPNS
jgi:valyl-tRNA synthetase